MRRTGIILLALALAFEQASGQTATPETAPTAESAAKEIQPNSVASNSKYLPWEKGSISLGGFIATFDSSLSFGLNNEPGIRVSAEDTFGLDSSLTVLRAEAMYRPGKSLRNQLDFYYASYHRSGDATLASSLPIDGVTYPIGAQIHSVFNFDLIRGTYSYAIVQNERLRVALGLGIYAVPLKYNLEITTLSGQSAVEGANTTLPLPAVALRAEFQAIPRVYINVGADGMYLEINSFRGSIFDLNAGLEYRPWKYFGIGASYNYMGVNVNTETTSSDYPGANFVGSVDVHFSGVMLYGKFWF